MRLKEGTAASTRESRRHEFYLYSERTRTRRCHCIQAKKCSTRLFPKSFAEGFNSMSFLDWPIESAHASPQSSRRRLVILNLLIARFRKEFPEIEYDVLWESTTINAQAWTLGSSRYVRVYGGLARHPALSRFGLSLSLAHETGHHLAGAPHDPALPHISHQTRADYWAARYAMPRIWRSRAYVATLRGATELLELHRSLSPELKASELDIAPEERYKAMVAGAFGADIGCTLECVT